MKIRIVKCFLLGPVIVFTLALFFQNCGPAKLTTAGDLSLPSQSDALNVGSKVDLPTLLQSPRESSANILFPSPADGSSEYTLGTPIMENIILKNSDFDKVIWVHGPSSKVVSVGDGLNQMNFSTELAGLYYVFGYRKNASFLIATMQLNKRTTTSVSVTDPTAMNVSNITSLLPGNVTERVLIQIKAPSVDFSTVQFLLPTTGQIITSRRAIAVTKNVAENLVVQINVSDVSGQSVPVSITIPAKSMLSISQSSINYGNVAVGSYSAAQVLTLTNAGTVPISLTDVYLFSAGFSGFGTTCTIANPIPPGGSCTASSRFGPTEAGLKLGTFTIRTNAVNPVVVVPLSGFGI
jgi:hypothetical protein